MKTQVRISKVSYLYVFCFLLIGLCTSLSAQEVPVESRSMQRIPMIKANVKVKNTCKTGKSCGTWLASMKKVNAIEITNLTTNWYPSLTYEIYDCSTSPCTSIDVFTCSDPVVTFASSKLVNGGLTTIILKDPNSTNSAMYPVTNGSFNGQICGNGASTIIK